MRVHPLLHARRSAPRLSAVAPSILCRVHYCNFYYVYRRTRLFRAGAAALNSKFLSQRARTSRSRPFARIHPPEKTFARMISSETYFSSIIAFMANACRQNFSGKKVLAEIIRAKVFSGGRIRVNGWESLQR